MKKLLLDESNLHDEDNEICVGKLMDCLHNLEELILQFPNISPELKSKLKTRGDEVGCKVYFSYQTMNKNVGWDWINPLFHELNLPTLKNLSNQSFFSDHLTCSIKKI